MPKLNEQTKAELLAQIAKIIDQIKTSENDLKRLKTLAEALHCGIIEPPKPPIIGVNMGKEYDQVRGNHPIINYGIKHVRVFMLLEDIYGGKYPSIAEPDYNPNKFDDYNTGMMGYRTRLRQMKEQGFDVRISLESIFEKDQNGHVLRTRKFPNKSFSRAEWGGTETAVRLNAKKLAIAIHRMYGEYISRIEFTNEAWGEPGFEATKWIIRGMYEGLREVNSDLKLSLGAYQAYDADNRFSCQDCRYPNGDFIGHVFEPWMATFIDEITIHPYSFLLETIKLTEPPLNNDSSEFKYLYDMVKWRDDNYPDLKLSITEIGWNSAQIGEDLQATYLNQVIEEAARLNIHAVYLYEAVDSPTDPVFSTCGLYTTDSPARVPRRPKKILQQLAATIGTRATEVPI